MVPRAGGYYRARFHREREVTQGDPLSPPIFNVVVDLVVFPWESLVAAREGGDISEDNRDGEQTKRRTIQDQYDGRKRLEEGHQSLTVKAEFFYVYNGMLASTDLGWIQLEFYKLTGMFDWVGLQTNIRKTVGMVYRPCRVAGVREDEA